MKLISTLRRINSILDGCSIVNTLYYNFKLFPFSIAVKLPLKFNHRFCSLGLRKGCIVIDAPIKPFMIKMGSSHWYQENSSRKGKYTYLRLGEGSTITFKGAGRISEGDSIVLAAGVNLEIGENFYINMDTRINAYEDMKIGRNLRCSWECQIFDTDFHAVYNAATNSIQRISRKVVIGDNVWLANRVSVGKGAYIPSSSIVGAHSYINKDYSDIKTKGNLFVGTPAKLIATDRYRFLDSEFDEYIKIYFRNNPDKTTFDVSQLPDFDLNKLLNVKTFGKIESI